MLPRVVLSFSTHERLSLLVRLLRGQRDDDLLEFVDQELARADLVGDRELPRNAASLGSRVRYRDNIAGAERTVTLAYPGHERHIAGGLSVFTPEGACLLGLTEGQSMTYWKDDAVVCDVTLYAVLG